MARWSKSELKSFVRRYKRPQWSWLWGIAALAPFGGCVISTDNKNPYLMRIYLTPNREDLEALGVPKKLLDFFGVKDPLRVYLHFFFRGDSDRELHNHPKKWAMSLILTGGYEEERWDPVKGKTFFRTVRPLTFNTICKEDFHKVTLLKPEEGCWTLFFSKGREHESDGTDWGFLNAETLEYTPWGKYVQRN